MRARCVNGVQSNRVAEKAIPCAAFRLCHFHIAGINDSAESAEPGAARFCSVSPAPFTSSQNGVEYARGAQPFRQLGLERERSRSCFPRTGKMRVESLPARSLRKVAHPCMRRRPAPSQARHRQDRAQSPSGIRTVPASRFSRNDDSHRIVPANNADGPPHFRPAFFRRLHL